MNTTYYKELLEIDSTRVAEDLIEIIKRQIRQDLRKEGAIVGISGGIDSSLVAALSVETLGKDKVLGVIMPEKDSSSDSQRLAEELAKNLGIQTVVENITGVLNGFECYRRRDEAIKRIFPDYSEHHKVKIGLATSVLEKNILNYFKVTIEAPDGTEQSKRMPLNEYLQIVAASNFKQRARMSMLYYHADRLNWAVVGTGNKDEHELGFFVKYGDGGADLKPIAHLYKLQVFQLAKLFPIPEEIQKRTPTTDTYSSEISQTEFFFGVDFDLLDHIWFGMENGYSPDSIAKELNLTKEQAERAYADIKQKQRTTNYLRLPPLGNTD